MKRFLLFALLMGLCIPAFCQKHGRNAIQINAEPKETAIYVNNIFIGYGYGEFRRPSGKHVAVIRLECDEYTSVHTKFYAGDKRKSISYTLQQDGFYRGSAASGLVNKFITITLDTLYYTRNSDKTVNVEPAWRLLHQILLNYFPEFSATDYSGGYLQTAWDYKKFPLSEKLMRTRVTIRDITNADRVAFQIKVSSEVAGAMAAKTGEFSEIDRLVKEFEPMVEELQTRIGKVANY